MEVIADGLLIATAATAGLYCLVLNRRLRNLADSSGGIGEQIDSLDRTLAETRAALAETRDGVAELRGSAKASLSDLSRQCAAATDLASRLEDTARRADATLQRLYQAERRIAAYDHRLVEGTVNADGPADAFEVAPDDGAETGKPGPAGVPETDTAPAPMIELPGAGAPPVATEGPAPVDSDRKGAGDAGKHGERTADGGSDGHAAPADPSKARPRSPGVLRAERMMS